MTKSKQLLEALRDADENEAFATMATVTADDKPKILNLLKPLGLKLRMKVFPNGLRLNIDSEMDKEKAQKICDILNEGGYLFAGGSAFSVTCFNGLQELFIRGKDKKPLTPAK